MLYFTCDIANIEYFPENKTVLIHWNNDFEDANKYFLILSKAFTLLKDKGCQHWVSDLRAKGKLSFLETEWLRKYMMPHAIENNVKKIAFIINQGDEENVKRDAILRATQARLNLRFFYSQTEAFQWFETKIEQMMG